jgi:hypothetical protein
MRRPWPNGQKQTNKQTLYCSDIFCGRSPAEITGSSPVRGHGCLSVVSVVCLSGRGLCDELITRSEELYRLGYVVVCDLETSRICTPCIYDISTLRVKIKRAEFLIMLVFQQGEKKQLCHCTPQKQRGGAILRTPHRFEINISDQ